VLKERKLYMLKNEELIVEIIQLHNNILVAEYGGQWKMMELVTRKYWWPEVTKDVEIYINRCDICQRMKNCIKVSVRKLIANKMLEKL